MVIVPVRAAALGASLAGAVVGAAADAAVVGAAADGAVLAPVDEQAASAIVATTARAPIRFVNESVSWSFLLWGRVSGHGPGLRVSGIPVRSDELHGRCGR